MVRDMKAEDMTTIAVPGFVVRPLDASTWPDCATHVVCDMSFVTNNMS